MSVEPKVGDILVIDWAGRIREVEVHAVRPGESTLTAWVIMDQDSGGFVRRSLYNIPRDTILEIKAA